jgi:hypothetical protein
MADVQPPSTLLDLWTAPDAVLRVVGRSLMTLASGPETLFTHTYLLTQTTVPPGMGRGAEATPGPLFQQRSCAAPTGGFRISTFCRSFDSLKLQFSPPTTHKNSYS